MLILFDLDGTLITPYMATETRDYNEWQVKENVRDVLQRLMHFNHQIAIVTNQAGVAFRYITEEDVCRKFARVATELGYDELGRGCGGIIVHDGRADGPLRMGWSNELHFYVEYSHSNATRHDLKRDSDRRKPAPGMILEAMRDFGRSANETLFVGDSPEDERAAYAAGVEFRSAEAFFANA